MVVFNAFGKPVISVKQLMLNKYIYQAMQL